MLPAVIYDSCNSQIVLYITNELDVLNLCTSLLKCFTDAHTNCDILKNFCYKSLAYTYRLKVTTSERERFKKRQI